MPLSVVLELKSKDSIHLWSCCWIPTSAWVKQLCDGRADTHVLCASDCRAFGAIQRFLVDKVVGAQVDDDELTQSIDRLHII